MRVEKLTVGQLRSNCYLAIDEESETCLVIDPGDDADYIVRRMKDFDVEPEAVVATHGHFDHIMAATELILGFEIPFLASKNDEFLIKRAGDSAKYFTGAETLPSPEIKVDLDKEEEIEFADNKLEIIKTPGHTPGSVCLFSESDEIVFVGDLIFEGGGVGRTDFSYADEKTLIESIKKLKKLPEDTLCYPGHGDEFYLEDWNK